MSRFATVLAHSNVCIARVACVVRAISFLVLVFAFALLLAFLERVDLHLVAAPVPYPADTVGFAPKFRKE